MWVERLQSRSLVLDIMNELLLIQIRENRKYAHSGVVKELSSVTT